MVCLLILGGIFPPPYFSKGKGILMKPISIVLFLAMLLSGCASGLFSEIRRSLPENASDIELELIAGRVELVAGFDDMNGEHHQWKLACSVLGEMVTSAAERQIYYNCSTEYDEFALIKVDGQGKYVVIYGPLGLPIFNNHE